MRIEINKRMYLPDHRPSVLAKPVKVSGYTNGKEVFMPPQHFVEAVVTYFHEMGHCIGDQLSFRARNILTPDEAKKTRVPLTTPEKLWLAGEYMGSGDRPVWLSPRAQAVCNRVLTTVTKNGFDLSSIPLHRLTRDAFDTMMRMRITQAAVMGEDGRATPISSRWGRNSELPPFAIEAAAITILERTFRLQLGRWYIEPDYRFALRTGSHQRALNIVARAYAGSEWTLPSTVDLEQKTAG